MPTNNQSQTQTQNGTQPLEVVQLVVEIIMLIIQMIYHNIESLYKIFIPPPEKSVKGEVVLVTGAGHGIGKQLALQYAALGATVIAWDVNEQNNSETVKEINKRGNGKGYGYICDVSNRDMVFQTVDKVRKDVGDITIIINNAGIMPTHNLLEQTPEEIERTFKINVFAHFWIIQAILPNMLKNNHGHIVSISSCAGIAGVENLVPYCGTKFAVRGYMEALEHEVDVMKPNNQIKFTTICPYMVDTGLCKKPVIRFKSMNMIPPEMVAARTIEAQRRAWREITIPGHFWYMNNILRCGAAKAARRVKIFSGVTLESDL